MALSTIGQVLSFVLLVCILVLIARLILDWVQLLARSWRPTGFVAVLCEGIYTVTAVRRVIPPVRLGSAMLDLSPMVLLIGIYILQAIVNNTLVGR
jgi:YggT family protein